MRKYAGVKYISCSASFTKEEMNDLGEVEDATCVGQIEAGYRTVQGEITSVLSFDEYACCVSCHSKVDGNSEVLVSARSAWQRQRYANVKGGWLLV